MQFVEITAIIALTLLSSLLMKIIKNDSEYNQLIQDYRSALSEIQNLTQFLQNRTLDDDCFIGLGTNMTVLGCCNMIKFLFLSKKLF